MYQFVELFLNDAFVFIGTIILAFLIVVFWMMYGQDVCGFEAPERFPPRPSLNTKEGG